MATRCWHSGTGQGVNDGTEAAGAFPVNVCDVCHGVDDLSVLSTSLLHSLGYCTNCSSWNKLSLTSYVYRVAVVQATCVCMRQLPSTVAYQFVVDSIVRWKTNRRNVVGHPPSPPLDNIRVMVIVWRLRRNIIRTAPCWVVWHNVHSQQHTHTSSSYRSSRLGLSHWDPYATHRGGCLEL